MCLERLVENKSAEMHKNLTADIFKKARTNYELFHDLPAGSVTEREVADSSAGIYGWSSCHIQRESLERKTNTSLESSSGQLLISCQQGRVCDETDKMREHEFLERLVENTLAKMKEYLRDKINRVCEETCEVWEQENLERLVKNASAKMEKCLRANIDSKENTSAKIEECLRAEILFHAGLPIYGCSKCRDDPAGCKEYRRD